MAYYKTKNVSQENDFYETHSEIKGELCGTFEADL